MTEIHPNSGPLVSVPDDLTISQFILSSQHTTRPAWVWDRVRPWIIEEQTGREIGSDELRARVYGLANALKIRWNIGEDDVVCIFSANHIDYAVAIWAVHALGAVVSCANPMYTADELTYQLALVGARMVIAGSPMFSVALDGARASGVSQDCLILFDPLPGSTQPHLPDLIKLGLRENQQYTERRFTAGEARKKLAFLLCSSGTTGKPKAVMISHFSIIANLVQIAQHLKITDDSVPLEKKRFRPDSVTYAVLPFYHSFGLHTVLLGSMFFGSAIVISPKFHLERMLQSIQQYRVTHLFVVPPQVVLFCKSPVVKKYDLTSVYFLLSGAAPASAEITEQLTRILPNCIIGQGYGLTETATGLTFLQQDRKIGTPGAGGVLLPGIIARVVKPDGLLAGLNEPGELYAKTPSMALGYLNNPTATAETFHGEWIRTGDEVMINELNEVVVVDRIKELIKVRGFQVAPSELEGLLLDHTDVADVCVVGIPDDFSGELPIAFVVPSVAARARIQGSAQDAQSIRDAIIKYVADHKAQYKWLAGVEFVDAVPKNPSGKLLRRVLRDRAKEMMKKGELVTRVRSKL